MREELLTVEDGVRSLVYSRTSRLLTAIISGSHAQGCCRPTAFNAAM